MRVFADQTERVRGDAEILKFLAANGFPAERVAVDDPVSEFDGSGVIVTEFVEGGRPTDADGRAESPAVLQELGGLLGRLHVLPEGGGAVARPSDAQALVEAMSFLASVEDKVTPAGRERFEWLREQVENADDAAGLPEALTHGNFHLWSAVGTPGLLVIVGWAGSGRGPRLPALAWLLRTAAEGNAENVPAVMRGYREHVQLTDEECERLPAVLNLRALWLACLDYRMATEQGQVPPMDEGWMRPDSSDDAQRIAAAALG